jgi:predicted PurR-regulated permease PerM
MNPQWNTPTKHIVGVGLAIFGLYILYISHSILWLLIIAALVAFLLMPLVDFFNYRCRLPRSLAILCAYLIATIGVLLAPLVFVPQIIEGINFFTHIDYQILLEDTLQWSEESLLRLKQIETRSLGVNLNIDSLVDPALAYLQNTGADITLTMPQTSTVINSMQSALSVTYGLATNVAGTVFSGLITSIVLLFSAIYFSMDAHKFYNLFLQTVPQVYRPEITTLLARLNKTWRAYLRGQLYLMVIIGVVTWVGLWLGGLRGAFTLGVVAGVLELFPYVGPVLAAIPAIVVALIQGSTYLNVSHWVFVLLIIGFYTLVQQLKAATILPKLLGDAVDLHPLVVLIGVIVGANFAGILGALLAAPVIASGREIIRYLYLKMLGQDPYPPGFEGTETIKVSLLERSKTFAIKLRQATSHAEHATSPVASESPSEPAAKS